MTGEWTAAGLVAVLATASPLSAEEKVLNLFIWSDYLAPDTLENFTTETGIKVNVDNFDTSEMLEAKMLTGGSGYDLIVPNGPILNRLVAAGLLSPIDKSRLPNLDNIDAALAARAATQDPGNAHGVIYMWGTTGLGYNVGKVKAVLGDVAALDSWAVLLDPANAEKLAVCGIYASDSPADVFESTLAYLGKEPHSQAPTDYDAAAQVWAKIRPHISKFHNSEYIAALANGDICLAMGYSGDVLQAAERAEEAGNGVEIAYAIPKEGAFIWFDFLAVPKDAPHPEAAHAFMNYILRPEVSGPISNTVYYANANAKSAPFVAKEILEDPTIYPPPDVMARLFPEQNPTPELERMRTRLWTRIKTGQ